MDKALIDSLISKKSDEIDSVTIAKLLGVHRNTAINLCANRVLGTARKKTFGKTSGWLASRAEVIQFKINTHAQPYI